MSYDEQLKLEHAIIRAKSNCEENHFRLRDAIKALQKEDAEIGTLRDEEEIAYLRTKISQLTPECEK